VSKEFFEALLETFAREAAAGLSRIIQSRTGFPWWPKLISPNQLTGNGMRRAAQPADRMGGKRPYLLAGQRSWLLTRLGE
jgi:hypothetical protein